MEAVSEDLIKLLPREDLEELIRNLNSEVSELKDEVKFWRCRAEASSKEQGKVLNRSSISEEMLNELNNLAGKMDILKIVDDGVNKENKEESDSSKKKLQLPSPLLSNNNATTTTTTTNSNSNSNSETLNDFNSSSATENVSRVVESIKLKNVILKKAPPKMMSRADFVKKSELKNSGGFKKNVSSETSAQSQMITNIKKGSSRISLQWGCLTEEYPKYDNKLEDNLFRDYFSEFEEKLSVLISDEESKKEPKLELFSNSVFSTNSQIEDLQIPNEKLFEWFIKKENIKSKQFSVINSQKPFNNEQMIMEQGNSFDGEDNNIENKVKSLANKIEQKQIEASASEVRTCIFGSKTSRMLQITINYFKKKLPKNQQKNLDFFKKSILQCTLDKEGVNLLLETVPDPFENAAKYEVWKECVRSVEKYLENNSRETLLEEEEFVYFLSRIPNLSKRLECLILRSSFEQLYCESLKWIEEKIRGLELILNHQRLPLLFKAVVESRNVLNSKLGKENQQGFDKVKFIPLSSLKKLQSLKSPNIQGKTLLNFISSIVGVIFTIEEISILKKSSEKSINMVYTMVTDLIFSWLELRDGSENLIFSTEANTDKVKEVMEYDDEFQSIMRQFYSEKYSQMIKLCNTFRKMLRLYVASCYYFGDVSTFLPLGGKSNQGKHDLVETLFEFINKYNGALKQETVRENEQVSPKSVENTPKENLKKPFTNFNTSARRLSHIKDMKNILNPKDLSTQSQGSMIKPKTNIQQIFAKSIVRELNLKPLFIRNNENKGDKHVSFSDKKLLNINNDNTNTLEMTKNPDLSGNSNNYCKLTGADIMPRKSVIEDENRDSIAMEDIEKTMALSLEPFNGSEELINNDPADLASRSSQFKLGNRLSILELSNEAKEILSRDKNNNFNMNASSSFDDDVSVDDDNETVALSSPSYTRLLDISSMLDSSISENGESSNLIEAKLEDGTRKKVVIMAEDYESPVRDNAKFNRRQSIRRICQIATYLDNSGFNDDAEETSNDLSNALSRYKSPMISRKVNYSSNITSSPSSGRTENSQEADQNYPDFDPDFDPDFENDNSKTCVLSDMLEINNPLDELKQSNNNKENNIDIHSNNQLNNTNTDLKSPPEYSPQKITFTRKSGRFASTLSPP